VTTQVIKHIKPSGGDYASLAEAAADVHNLIFLDQQWDLVCDTFLDTAPADFTAWILGGPNFIRIRPTDPGQFKGTEDTNTYRLHVASGFAIHMGDNGNGGGTFISCEGVQFITDDPTNKAISFSGGTDGKMLLYRCQVISAGQGWHTTVNRNLDVFETTFVCAGSCIVREDGDCQIYQSTLITTQAGEHCVNFGASDGKTRKAFNTYAKGGGSGGNAYNGAGTTLTKAASNDTTGTATEQSIAYSTANFKNVTAGSENLQIPTGSALKDTGADRSGEPAPFNTGGDILGNSQPFNTNYDIGSYEYQPLPPVADFSADLTTIIAGTLVSFTDLSTQTPTSWAWTFGTGEGTSAAQNPTHTYNTPGTFTVTLTSTNADGSDLETKTNYIVVQAAVVADFHADVTTVELGDQVHFTDDSTGSPTAWAWTFGTGQGSSMNQNPTKIYSALGTYDVSLTASKVSPNSSDVETKTSYITVVDPPPVADFHADVTTTGRKDTIQFTDDSTNNPTSWLWDFGDSNTSTDQNPTHQYAALGNYTVTLTATNAQGSDPEVKTNYIHVVPPTEVDILVDPGSGDYPSLFDMAADAQDLVAQNVFWVVTVSSFAEVTSVDFTGWNTDDTRYLDIRIEEPSTLHGALSGDSYSLTGTLLFSDIGTDGYAKLSGIQAVANGANQAVKVDCAAGATVEIGRIIAFGNGATPAVLAESGTTLMYDSVVNGHVTQSGGTCKIYSSTVIGTVDLGDVGSGTLFNVYALAYLGLTAAVVTSSASADNSGSLDLRGIPNDTSTFLGTDDFRLQPTSPLKDSGSSRSGEDPPFDFADDFSGSPRPDDGGLEDVGAFEQFAVEADWPTDVFLVTKGPALAERNSVKSSLTLADDSTFAKKINSALSPDEGWENSSTEQVATPAAHGWYGWTFKIDGPFKATYVGHDNDTLTDVLDGLSAQVGGSSVSGRKLVLASSGYGDRSMTVTVTPPEATRPVNFVVLRINQLASSGDELSVVFANVLKIPKVIKEF
jgi:PKD repeat protein